jgi:hypothetical protein
MVGLCVSSLLFDVRALLTRIVELVPPSPPGWCSRRLERRRKVGQGAIAVMHIVHNLHSEYSMQTAVNKLLKYNSRPEKKVCIAA